MHARDIAKKVVQGASPKRLHLGAGNRKRLQAAAKKPGAITRMRNLAAYGPLTYKPIDIPLLGSGWAVWYDDESTGSVRLAPGAEDILFNRDGTINVLFATGKE